MVGSKTISDFLKSAAPSVVLLPDSPKYTIVQANEGYLKLTNSTQKSILGKEFFEVFPKNPENIISDGFDQIRKSLENVIRAKTSQTLTQLRYDIPIGGTGRFQVKYWDIENSPWFDNKSNVEYIVISVVDITEKMLAQYRLQNAEIEKSKHKELLEQAEILAKIGSWEVNLSNNKIHWSDGVFRICEYEPQEFEVTLQKRLEIIHPDDRQKAAAFWQEIIDSGKECRIEKRYITKNNTIKYITSIGKPVLDSKGKPYKIFGVYQDVTDVKQAEAKAQERRVFIETALEHLPIGIAVNRIDDSRATLMNKEFSKIYGWPAKELTDVKTFFQKIYPDDKYREEITKRITEDIMSGDINRMNWEEITITTQTGEQKVISAKNIPVYSQNLMISTVIDVTDKVKARNAILDTNERYKYVTKATFDAIWDWDIETDFVYWGEGFETIFGYKLNELVNNSTSGTENIHPDDLERVVRGIEEVIESKEANWTDEYRYRKANGQYAFIINKGIVIRNEHGNAVKMIGAMQDITVKKLEEERLKLLESVVTNTNDAVLITEAEPFEEPGPKIVYVNEAFTKMTGYTAEEVIGKTPRILQGPKSDKEELKRLGNALRNWETCEITTINYKKSGEEFWLNFSVTPVANEKGWYTHWIAIERDVTERKLQEEKLLEANLRITNTLESIQDGFYALDKNWIVTYWNHEAERITGRKREKIIGKSLWEVFNKFSSKKTIKEFNYAVDNNTPVRFETYSKASNSWFEISAFPLEEGLTVYFKVIDDRKKAELKLLEINKELKEHARELAVSNEELEQFAYVASHDLQEPLRMVTSFLSQLEKKYGEALDEKGKKYIYFAVDGAKRMRQIILDLLEYSRVGKSDDTLEMVNLNEVVEEIQLLYRRKIEEKKGTVICHTLPTIPLYRSPIRQILQNLISNALKYSKAEEAPIVTISSSETKKFWQIEVNDNGIGIDKEYFDKIFIIFQRLHNKDEYSGTGMGLSIAKKIIENFGGQIWLTSVEGKGTTFFFTLPKK